MQVAGDAHWGPLDDDEPREVSDFSAAISCRRCTRPHFYRATAIAEGPPHGEYRDPWLANHFAT
jgi:hypothetical protein